MLGTNPLFKKPLAIGEKVTKLQGKCKGFTRRKAQNKSLKYRIIKNQEIAGHKKGTYKQLKTGIWTDLQL